MFEGWLGGHYNVRRPEVVWTISYIIPHILLFKIKSKYTRCHNSFLRIFTFEQIILNHITVAKHLVVLTVLDYSCVVIFAKKSPAHRNQQLQRVIYWNSDRSPFQYSRPLSCQLTYHTKLRPLAVCIHKDGSNLCEVTVCVTSIQSLLHTFHMNIFKQEQYVMFGKMFFKSEKASSFFTINLLNI